MAGSKVVDVATGEQYLVVPLPVVPSGGSSVPATWVTSVGATAPITTSGGTTPNIGITTPLALGYGGTGTASPALIAGSGIGITGSWPNQTIANTQTPGSTTLAGDTDVLISSPTDTQVLTYETASSKWKNKAAPAGGGGATPVTFGAYASSAFLSSSTYTITGPKAVRLRAYIAKFATSDTISFMLYLDATHSVELNYQSDANCVTYYNNGGANTLIASANQQTNDTAMHVYDLYVLFDATGRLTVTSAFDLQGCGHTSQSGGTGPLTITGFNGAALSVRIAGGATAPTVQYASIETH